MCARFEDGRVFSQVQCLLDSQMAYPRQCEGKVNLFDSHVGAANLLAKAAVAASRRTSVEATLQVTHSENGELHSPLFGQGSCSSIAGRIAGLLCVWRVPQ